MMTAAHIYVGDESYRRSRSSRPANSFSTDRTCSWPFKHQDDGGCFFFIFVLFFVFLSSVSVIFVARLFYLHLTVPAPDHLNIKMMVDNLIFSFLFLSFFLGGLSNIFSYVFFIFFPPHLLLTIQTSRWWLGWWNKTMMLVVMEMMMIFKHFPLHYHYRYQSANDWKLKVLVIRDGKDSGKNVTAKNISSKWTEIAAKT